MRYIGIISLCIVLAWLPLSSSAADQTQERLENAQDMVETLVDAKDEGAFADIGLRIQTFKKVLELAISEAQQLKVSVLAAESSSNMATSTILWRDSAVRRLEEAIAHYEEVQSHIQENQDALLLSDVRETAKSFKEWRNTNYLPLYEEIASYLMLNKNEKVIAVTESRWGKIKKDMLILREAGFPMEELETLFSTSTAHLEDARALYEHARELFQEQYVAALTATSTPHLPAGEESAQGIATSTDELPEESLVSIKDLIKESFQNIKETYQVFIEMSSLVRKLL
mgnify:CR=1 FL=1